MNCNMNFFRRPAMFCYVLFFPLISSVVGVWRIYSYSLLLFCFINAPFTQYTFILFFFSLFPVALFHSPHSILRLSLFILRLSSPFSTNARDTERALAIKAIMRMFTKALIHQNKEQQRERGRRMDDKGERED